jgi:hypothetical protein
MDYFIYTSNSSKYKTDQIKLFNSEEGLFEAKILFNGPWEIIRRKFGNGCPWSS